MQPVPMGHLSALWATKSLRLQLQSPVCTPGAAAYSQRGVLQVKYRGQDKGKHSPKSVVQLGWQMGVISKDSLKKQNERREVEWTHLSIWWALPGDPRATAAKHLFVCQLLLLSFLWEKLQFLSAQHKCFKTTEKQSVRDLRESYSKHWQHAWFLKKTPYTLTHIVQAYLL